MNDVTQTGVVVDAADQPDISQEQPVQQNEQEHLVPLSALQAERRERQQLQENLKLMQDHIALMQSNTQKQNLEKNDFSGLNDNDVLTVGEAKKFMSQFSKQQELAVEELKMAQAHTDYNEVVRKHLPEVLKNDPDLKDMILSAPNPYKAAYYLAKRSDSYLQEQRKQLRSPEANQAVQNLQRAGNLSSVGTPSVLSGTGNYKNMSDKEFKELADKNRGYY